MGYTQPPDKKTFDYIISQSGTLISATNTTGGTLSQGTDATVVIQSAINASTPCGRIYIQSGAYPLSAALTIDATPVEIYGNRSSILTTVNATAAIILGSGSPVNNVILSGFTLQGNNVGTVGISGVSVSRSIIRDMYVTQFTGWGIDLQFNHSVHIEDSRIDYNGTLATTPYSGGVKIGSSSPDTKFNNVKVDGCIIEHNVTGVWVCQGYRVSIVDCVIESQTKHGVALDKQSGTVFPRNVYIRSYFESNNGSTSATIYDVYGYGYMQDVVLDCCYFDSANTTYSIYFANNGVGIPKACTIRNCYFKSTADNYLYIGQVLSMEIHGNMFADTTPDSGITVLVTSGVFSHDNYPWYEVMPTTSAGSILPSHSVTLVDATAGAKAMTMPDPSCHGGPFTIKKSDSSGNAVTVGPYGAETFDGAANVSLATQYKYVTLKSDGTNWIKLGSN